MKKSTRMHNYSFQYPKKLGNDRSDSEFRRVELIKKLIDYSFLNVAETW